ncbi:uncharacterized protein LOC126576528 [Anopheles aquasalis]|uniref:uncharacterized protein LOC126576528 n=1 Tax=Anopheles aquasalis TaxID=42839 RepID=UPI00215B74E7|nr:uncharacterized protein LOC126576528 [Anopheles aquasalis]
MNLSQLLAKYSEFNEVNDDLFVYLDRLLENAFEIHKRTKVATAELRKLELQLTTRKQPGKSASPASSPVKKRKIRSTESSFSARKENVSAVVEDSHIFPCKSDPESSVGGWSVLEQNIIDPEESFFASSQSPHKKEALSVSSETARNNASNRVSSPVVAVKISPPQSKGKWEGSLLRKSMLGSSVTSVSSVDEIKASPAASSSPTVAGSKWASKKFPIDNTAAPKHEHTPISVKRFFSLCESPHRLRQTKLSFTETSVNRAIKKTVVSKKPIEDDSWMVDFVVPTPPSTEHKGKLARSWRNKKQSTMLPKADHSATVNKCALNLAADAITAKRASSHEVGLTDVDRTFYAGADGESKQLAASSLKTKIKPEPPSQLEHNTVTSDFSKPNKKDARLPNGVSNKDISDVVLVQPSSQESIISLRDSPAPDGDMASLKEQHGQHNQTFETAPNNSKTDIWDDPVNEVAPLQRSKSDQSSDDDALCVDCKKMFKFHKNRGRSDETIRFKLPKNCRSCRMFQLHHTPPDFWNPDFLPSQ